MFKMRAKIGTLLAGAAIILALGVNGAAGDEKEHHKDKKGDHESTEEDFGIRKDNLYDEKNVKLEHGDYSQDAPGSSKKIERTFENSPPLIPHDITGMLPISVEGNLCMGCHMPEEAVRSGATPIPRSHLMKMAKHEDLHGHLDHERFNCMECHVPQVEGPIPVENTFKGGFKDKKSKSHSNLVDTLNEGVTAD